VTELLPTPPEAAITAAVLQAIASREPVHVQGNGTKAAMLRPVQAARTLSSSACSGISLYAPKELIITAGAGTPLPEIEAALAEQGQHLIAEPPDLAELFGQTGRPQTLGGLVATNLSGPRRVAWGAMRDHVMGIRAVTGHGELIHSGGRVLKNVTGLDLCKLLTGSHGTLGLITEVTLKVLPAPEACGTVVVAGLDAASGVAALSAALGSPYGVSGAAWLPREAAARVPALAHFGGSVALARIEEFASSVAYRTERLRADLGGAGEILDDPTSRSVWRAVRDAVPLPAQPQDAIWRVSVRPSAGAGVLAAVGTATGFLDWGGGLVWLAGPADETTHEAVSRAALAAGGTWTLLRGPETLRAAVAVVPPEVEALANITRRVKQAMDPHGIFNPGRIYAGL
jgi:glycolate oxidase FAD binding subunit